MRSALTTATDDDAGTSDREQGDAERQYVDLEGVTVGFPEQPHWTLRLAAPPPKASTLDPTRTVISYGLTFETTGDAVADYVVGISNAACEAGDFRVWVTDLATGDTNEQVGPPYGYPIEFAHPDEGAGSGMLFTFLPGSAVGGIGLNTPFYAWASVEENGQVVAWDYAPNIGWRHPTVNTTAAPAPEPVTGGGSTFPECRANAYDFVGESTLAALGLQDHVPAELPEPERPAMIWVTRDLLPHDFGAPGGPVEMTRMLCFEFADGSGGSGWPVDAEWQPPDQ